MKQVAGPRLNSEPKNVAGFDEKWMIDQEQLDPHGNRRLIEIYLSPFPFAALSTGAEGCNLGCATARCATLAALNFATRPCIHPSSTASSVATRRLANLNKVTFHEVWEGAVPFANGSQDFGDWLGVRHHIPDTAAAHASCVRKLKLVRPFLHYIHCAFDNRPRLFRPRRRVTESRHWLIAQPFPLRMGAPIAIATTVYSPLSRGPRLLKARGGDIANVFLTAYRHNNSSPRRTDALNPFGRRLEQRLTCSKTDSMVRDAGLFDTGPAMASLTWRPAAVGFN